jgi:perosamine synthetase
MSIFVSPIDIEGIHRAIRTATTVGDKRIVLHEPWFAGNEWNYVKDCIDTGWVSSVGAYVDRFESMIRQYTGIEGVVAVVNGTAALHVCLVLAGVGVNDEVLIPALSFVATANAVAYCGAVPHFVDVDVKTLGVDPLSLADYLADVCDVREDGCFNRKTGRMIKAVVPMHTFGHPVDLDALADVCSRFGIIMVEDAAESLGSLYKGRHTGYRGYCAALSFNGNKTITTGGGGAVLTTDLILAERARHITTTAKRAHPWEFYHDAVGYNYRLPNLNAALGCAQMEQLPRFIENKRRLAKRYQEAFRSVKGVRFFHEPEFGTSNYWLNTIVLNEEAAECRDILLHGLNDEGIMARPVWTPLNRLPMYEMCPCMELTVTEQLAQRLVNIPSSPSLGENDE